MLLAHLVSGRFGDPAVEHSPYHTSAAKPGFLWRLIALLFGKKT